MIPADLHFQSKGKPLTWCWRSSSEGEDLGFKFLGFPPGGWGLLARGVGAFPPEMFRTVVSCFRGGPERKWSGATEPYLGRRWASSQELSSVARSFMAHCQSLLEG